MKQSPRIAGLMMLPADSLMDIEWTVREEEGRG